MNEQSVIFDECPGRYAADCRKLQSEELVTGIQQGTDDWLKWRQQGVGATDAAGIVGESKWDTALSIYAKKTGHTESREQTSYQEWGTRIEPLLVDKLVEEFGYSDVRVGTLYTRGWAKCSLDGEATIPGTGERIIIECKTGRTAADWDPVPDGYYAQAQWQMFVTGYRKVHFSTLIGGVDWFDRLVEYNEDYVNDMYEKCHKFWDDLLKGIKPPVSNDGEKDYNALVAIRKDAEPKPAKELDKETFATFVLAKDNLDKAQAMYDKAKANLAYIMSDGSNLTYDGKTIAQFVQRAGAQTIDKKLLAQLAPDIYEKCLKRSGTVSYIKYL